jgi:hypothetical protein
MYAVGTRRRDAGSFVAFFIGRANLISIIVNFWWGSNVLMFYRSTGPN